MTILTIPDLTEASLTGEGVFDVLMRANKAHLEAEFTKGRIKGSEYATVYLGSLESVLQNSMSFLIQRERVGLEAELLKQQIILAEIGVLKANIELQMMNASLAKIPAEIALLEKQAELTSQQKDNLVLTALNIPKEGLVLDGQKCKLDAEFDLLQSEKLKSISETALLTQKGATERAQTTALGVDEDSVIGKQKSLYGAQTAGFARDAEQKAAKLLADTWSVRRTTDEGTGANDAGLGDASIAAVISKLRTGIGA